MKGPIGSRVELMANELLKATVVDNWRRKWQPTLVFLPGESHGQRSLVGYSPWGCKESETTEQLTHTVDNPSFWLYDSDGPVAASSMSTAPDTVP